MASASNKPDPVWPQPTCQEMMAVIRSSLRLGVTDIAKILRVERPTVYAWMREESEPRLHRVERMGAVYAVAMEWRSLSSMPFGEVMETQETRHLVKLLSQKTLPREDISRLFKAQVEARRAAPDKPRRLYNLSDVARENGFKLPEPRADDDEFDVFTGKRFDME